MAETNNTPRFIVIDGPDGAGKSTQVGMLMDIFKAAGIPAITTVDPGGTSIGERLRDILLGNVAPEICPLCETLLFTASRAQLVDEIVSPALASGKIVICDRFISATIAYQGALGMETDRIIELADFSTCGTWPDMTIVLDIPPEKGMERKGETPDRMESRTVEYHREVRRIYLELEKIYPAPVRIVNAEGTRDEVHESILEILGLQT